MKSSSGLAQMLTRYKAWADALTYEMAIALPWKEVVKERPTTFKTIGHTLQHITIVDEIFRAHLENREHGYRRRTVEALPQLDDLRRRTENLNAWWIDYAGRLTDDALAEPIDFTYVNGDRGRMTRLEIVLHVVQHASYHRGYVDDMMYQVPVTPPATDLTVFLQSQ